MMGRRGGERESGAMVGRVTESCERVAGSRASDRDGVARRPRPVAGAVEGRSERENRQCRRAHTTTARRRHTIAAAAAAAAAARTFAVARFPTAYSAAMHKAGGSSGLPP